MSPCSLEYHTTDLTHWGRVTHICVSKITIIGSDNGLSSGRRQAILWTSVGILFIGPLGTNFSEVLIEIYTFSFKKMHLKMSSGKWRPFCLGLNVLQLKWNEIQSCELWFKMTCWVAMRGILSHDKLIQYRKLILMAYYRLPLSHQSTLSFTETWWRYMQLSSITPNMCLQLTLRFPKSTHASQETLIHASCDVLDRNKLLGTWYEQTVGHLI